MKYCNSYLIVALLFLFFGAECFGPKTFFAPRSQSFDASGAAIGVRRLTNPVHECSNYSLVSWMTSYDQNFNNDDIAHYFFGSETLVFSGSRHTDRGVNDILADYFGLSTTAKSIVCFKPEIANYTNDFYWHLGLDAIAPSLYMSVRMPIVHTVWDLKLKEQIIDQGQAHPAGYMSHVRTELSDATSTRLNNRLASGVKEFFSGLRYTAEGQVVPLIIGDIQEPLCYGKIAKRQTMTRAAEIVVTLGYNFLDTLHYALGGNCFVAFPTGNHSNAQYLFEAMVGNGGHWELGVGLKGYVDLWNSEHGTHALSLHTDAQGAYLFSAKQHRSFDFKKQGNGSRYMLLEQLGQPSNDLFLGDTTGPASPYQYEGRLIPAINATTLDIKTSIPFEGELNFSGLYEYKNASIEVGYNLYGRTKEHGHDRACFPSNVYALKGDAQLYGFDGDDLSYALAATENAATIHAGQGVGNFVTGSAFANDNVDTAIQAANSTTILNNLTAADAGSYGGQLTVQTSETPVLLNDSDINSCSGLLPWSISHRLFVHCSHYWNDGEVAVPFLGIGGFVEWAQGESQQVGLQSRWNIALKGGVLF